MTKKLNVPVKKRYLYIVSGLMWLIVGLMLMNFARGWLLDYPGNLRWLFILSGVSLALIIHHFGFLRVVDKNLGRIKPMIDKPSVFAFMSARSYLLIAVMMSFGILLRRSEMPREYLSVIYIGLGLALFLSSIRYIRIFIQTYSADKHYDA